MSQELDDVLIAWVGKYGEEKIGKKYGNPYKTIPKDIRKELIGYLVDALILKGKDYHYFKTTHVRNAIAAACFGPVVYDKESRKRGYFAVLKELDWVIAEKWPDPDFAEMGTAKPAPGQEFDPATDKSPFKELDRSLLKEAPVSADTVNLEISKLLGFNDE